MECEAVIKLFLLCLFTVLSTSAEEKTTETVELVEEGNTTTKTVLSNGRSLPTEENLIKTGGKRNPKFGFAIPFPNIPGVGGDFNSTPGSNNPDSQGFGGMPMDNIGSTATLGTTAVLIKGGILSGLTALKAAIIPPIFLGALILFLIAGAAFFTCSVVNCGRIIGDFGGPSFGPGFGEGPHSFNPFTRNGIEEYEQRPIYQSIDDAYTKYNN